MKHLTIVGILLFVSQSSLAQTLNCSSNVIGNTTYKTCYDNSGNSYTSTTQSIGNQQYTNGYYSSGNSLNRTRRSTGTPPYNYDTNVVSPIRRAMQVNQRRQAQENQEREFGIQERQLKLQEQQLKMAQQQRELAALEQEFAKALLDLAERMKDEDFRREFEKAMNTGKEK